MRELRDILAAFAELAEDETAILTSVVHAAGSTYRRPGARMLVLPDDRMIGLISGGCLEGDLLEHAGRVRAEGEARLVHYDATAEDDILWGSGLGCAGIVDVLLEPVSSAGAGPLPALAAWREARQTGVLATALGPGELGRRWALHPDGRIEGPPAPNEVRAALEEGRAGGRSRRVAGAGGDLAVEVVPPPLRLVVFGAGPDAGPVARLALELGWDVALSDPRPASARPDRFPGASVHCVPAEEAVAAAAIDAGTHVIVMTHHYLHDRALLEGLLPSPAPYVGLLGPKQRARDLLADLADQGAWFSEEELARLHAPAGLDLGGEGPEAIALSLVGEVQARAQQRPGGWLRARKGPIHDPSP